MAFYASARFGLCLFQRTLQANAAGNFSELRQEFAINSAAAGDITWDQAIQIVRETYAQGAGWGMARASLRPTGAKLPTSLVKLVLSNPLEYPAQLYDHVTEAQKVIATSGIKPVIKVASREKWFSR
jgi:hypothetical protein